MLAIRLPPDIEKRLANLALVTGRTKTFYARQAILEHLADIEDHYLAQRELKKVKSGRSKTKSLKKVMEHYGMED